MDIDFRKLIENIPAVFYRCKCDNDWTMYFISDAIEEITGYPASDFILNGTRTYTSVLHKDDLQGALDAVDEAVGKKTPWEIEYRMVTNDGTIKWVHEKGIADFDDHGELLYLDGFITDISDARNLEAELNHARKMESIGCLAAGIAHEINTPSQYINDNLFFLKDSFRDIIGMIEKYQTIIESHKTNSIGEKIAKQLEEIYDELDFEFLQSETPEAIEQAIEGIERIRKIVSAMKAFSHPGNNERQLFCLNKSLESTVSVAINEWKYIADIELNLAPELPEISCYPDELGQVFLNILVNATHAITDVQHYKDGEKGHITISTKALDGQVEVRIADNGTGMPDEVKSKIFDPFFTTKDIGKGTGQGLSIAYSIIVDKHDGNISVESIPNEGTTFIMQLPITKVVEEIA